MYKKFTLIAMIISIFTCGSLFCADEFNEGSDLNNLRILFKKNNITELSGTPINKIAYSDLKLEHIINLMAKSFGSEHRARKRGSRFNSGRTTIDESFENVVAPYVAKKFMDELYDTIYNVPEGETNFYCIMFPKISRFTKEHRDLTEKVDVLLGHDSMHASFITSETPSRRPAPSRDEFCEATKKFAKKDQQMEVLLEVTERF